MAIAYSDHNSVTSVSPYVYKCTDLLLLRKRPFCWYCCWRYVHVQAVKSMRPMQLDVEIPDGRRLSVNVDSASTSSELCDMIADNISIKDAFGFSLHVTIDRKVRATARAHLLLRSSRDMLHGITAHRD